RWLFCHRCHRVIREVHQPCPAQARTQSDRCYSQHLRQSGDCRRRTGEGWRS
ncbi:hypothetical protein FOZ62_031724, partial [Perkinsus olseni]